MRRRLGCVIALLPSTLGTVQTTALPPAPSGCWLGTAWDVDDEGSASLLQHAALLRQRSAKHWAEPLTVSTTSGGWADKEQSIDVSSSTVGTPGGQTGKHGQPNRGSLLSHGVEDQLRHFNNGNEFVLIVIGGLGATGMFLMGVAAYQQGHEYRERRGKSGGDVAQWQGGADQGVEPPGRTNENSGRSPRRSPIVVPPGRRLVCHLQCRLHKERQSLEFNVTSSPSRGQEPLLRVLVNELHQCESSPHIAVKHLDRDEQLVAVSTESLYKPGLSAEDRVFPVLNASGETFGTIQKEDGNTYSLLRSSGSCLKFMGRFREHSIQVMHEDLLAAKVEAVSAGGRAYRVTIEEQVDAGLVLIGLLAIDKCERFPPAVDHSWFPDLGSFFTKGGTSKGYF